ncbi:pentapeptide repeat-containing protein [Streptomyces sp. NPDC008092]|uniref:pentapeptide repeat-containing protein n=1 Tax=Streptomyces sp. NPDC008092 TaxID=3364808 RepID=UPI0036E89E09
MVASLPGLAALVALLFTWMQVNQASKELAISEQGQITNRFNAAINNLGSASLDVRLGGIYALERIMHDSVRDHSTVVSVLSAYLRTHAAVQVGVKKSAPESGKSSPPKADVQAVMTVLANRGADLDKGPIDLRRTNLHDVQLDGHQNMIPFREADLSDADLSDSSLSNLDLQGATLWQVNLSGAEVRGSRLDEAFMDGANLSYADLSGSHFDGARLYGAHLSGAHFCGELFVEPAQGSNGAVAAPSGLSPPMNESKRYSRSPAGQCADLRNADFTDADLSGTILSGMNLASTILCPGRNSFGGSCSNLNGAVLNNSNLEGSYLSGADLEGADLTHADLTHADLTNANLTNANLTGAKVSGAKFEGARLKGALGLPLPH